MKKIIIKSFFIILLFVMAIILSGCTLKIETTDNSVSASVDEDTTEKVDNIITWIKDRLKGIFIFEDAESEVTDSIGDGKGTIL